MSNNAYKAVHGDTQFKPNTTVAAIIHCQGKFLLVSELEHGKQVLNQPAGHLERGESLIDACQREVYEETGLQLAPHYISGIYHLFREDLDLYFLRFCFVIEVDDFITATPIDNEIIDTQWLGYQSIKQANLRSCLVLECIDDYLANKQANFQIPLSSIKTNI